MGSVHIAYNADIDAKREGFRGRDIRQLKQRQRICGPYGYDLYNKTYRRGCVGDNDYFDISDG